METHSEFYTADAGGGVEVWTVVSHTARTFRVQREWAHGRIWTRTVKSADIGKTFHITALAALSARATEEQDRLRFAQAQVQRHRTTIGMIEGHMRRLPGGAQLLALGEGKSDPALILNSESATPSGSATDHLSSLIVRQGSE